jgi:trans-aconitate methyltransferase
VDVGAGNGKLTSHFVNEFQKCVAIEPNSGLVRELRTRCPGVEVLEQRIDEAEVDCRADFILCSHVFYYLRRSSWLGSLEKMASWLGADGLLAVALQNPGTDCMKMFRHFLGSRFDLAALKEEFAARNSRFNTSLVTVSAMIRTSSAEEACTIAEFMLNLLPMSDPPRWADLESYVQAKFNRGARFEFSCNQDFLLVQA